MVDKEKDKLLQNLPACVAEYITLVIKKMRYRKKVQADVMAELKTHFEDELRDCKSDEEKEQKAQRLIESFGDPKLLAILMRRAKKRCRPLWRTVIARTFQTTGILILCLTLYTAWFFSGKPRITVNYVDQLNRVARPTADESLNAAPLYNKAAELYLKSPASIIFLNSKKPSDVNSEQRQTIEKWLTDNKEILDLVIAGSKKPYYWQTYNGKNMQEALNSIMPHLAQFRKLASILCWRAQLNAEKGNFKDALEDIKSCYRFSKHIKTNGATFVSQLVGTALEALDVDTLRNILSHYRIDSPTLTAAQHDFDQLIANDDFTFNLKGERICFYDEVQQCFTDDSIGGGHLYLKQIKQILAEQLKISEPNMALAYILPELPHILFTDPNKQQTTEMYDRYYDFWEKIAHKTPVQIKAEGIDINAEAKKIAKGNLLLHNSSSAMQRLIELSYRHKINVESTVPLIVIIRYKQDTGSYPENLDKLVETGYLKQIPTDPFSDKPLAYKKTDDNFIIYSFGSNCKDDGGQPDRFKNGKIVPFSDKGDWIFWPVEK